MSDEPEKRKQERKEEGKDLTELDWSARTGENAPSKREYDPEEHENYPEDDASFEDMLEEQKQNTEVVGEVSEEDEMSRAERFYYNLYEQKWENKDVEKPNEDADPLDIELAGVSDGDEDADSEDVDDTPDTIQQLTSSVESDITEEALALALYYEVPLSEIAAEGEITEDVVCEAIEDDLPNVSLDPELILEHMEVDYTVHEGTLMECRALGALQTYPTVEWEDIEDIEGTGPLDAITLADIREIIAKSSMVTETWTSPDE